MEATTMTLITAIIGTLIAVGASYAKNRLQAGEPFSIMKTVIVMLASCGLLVMNYFTNGVLLDAQTVFVQVMAFTGFGLTVNSSVKAVAAKSSTVNSVVQFIEQPDPALDDIGITILPTDQAGDTPYKAKFTVFANPGCSAGPNRVTEVTVNFGDGVTETFPVANGIANIDHVYTHSGNRHVIEEVHDIDLTARTAAGKVSKIIDQNDPTRFAARAGVRSVADK